MDTGRGKKLLLRLDDGSLIGEASVLGNSSTGVVRIDVNVAHSLGRAGEREVHRLERLLAKAQDSGVPTPGPIGNGDGHPSKRPRVESVPAPSVGAVAGPSDFVSKCSEIYNKVKISLGNDFPAFYHRVDPNALPDYYRIVKSPIFLCDVEDKLNRAAYSSAQDFASDLRLFWTNVKLYNPEADYFRKVGDRVSGQFEEWWAASGLCQEKARRATAGVAAPKYEPERFEAPAKPKASCRSQQGGKPSKSAKANGMARTMSHEVTSSKQGTRVEFISEARKQEIAVELGELDENHMEDLFQLLPPSALAGADGEVELDFESLDQESLRKIDAFLRRVHTGNGHQVPSPSGVSHNPSVRIDADSEDDDAEFNSDSD